jgi:hypothetical protein
VQIWNKSIEGCQSLWIAGYHYPAERQIAAVASADAEQVTHECFYLCAHRMPVARRDHV